MICARCKRDLDPSKFPHLSRYSPVLQTKCRKCRSYESELEKRRMAYANRFDAGLLKQTPRHAWGDNRKPNARERIEIALCNQLMDAGWDGPMEEWLDLVAETCKADFQRRRAIA